MYIIVTHVLLSKYKVENCIHLRPSMLDTGRVYFLCPFSALTASAHLKVAIEGLWKPEVVERKVKI